MQKSDSTTLFQQLKADPRTRLGLPFFAGFLASYALVVALLIQLHHHQVEITLQEYGTTVARQLAQASADTMLRDDRVSLHAQLESLVQMPNVVEAAVYDMENRLQAQATDAPEEMPPEEDQRLYPATISFQDSIVGKVMVRLDARPLLKSRHWLYLYLLSGLLLCATATLLVSHRLVRQGTSLYSRLLAGIHSLQPDLTAELSQEHEAPPTLRTVEKNLAQVREYVEQLEQGAPVVRFTTTSKVPHQPPAGSYAELLIECSNFCALQQQVHHKEIQRLLENVQQVVHASARLYHAESIPSAGNHLLLRFAHNDITDAALQAICCAVIIRSLAQAAHPGGLSLHLRFAIHWHEHDARPVPDLMRNHLLLQEQEELLQLCALAKTGDILVSKGIKRSAAVAEHIKLELVSGDSDADCYRVQKLSDNYRKLLEQQALQLASEYAVA